MSRFEQLPAGFRLLCLMARPAGAEPDHAIQATLAEIPDWRAVLDGAAAHHVMPLLARLLAMPAAAAMPPWAREELARRRKRQALGCLGQSAELIRLGTRFSEAGIRYLVVKGVVLSLLLYDDPCRRGLGDMDVLVDPARFADACAILLACGYDVQHARGMSPADMGDCGGLVRDLCFVRPDGHCVELHQRLTEDPTLLPLDFEAFWQNRRRPHGALGRLWTLSAEHTALYLLVHGGEHGWTRLRWIADLHPALADPVVRERVLALADELDLGAEARHALALERFLLADGPGGPGIDRHCRWFLAGDAWTARPTPERMAWYGVRELRVRWCRYTLRRTWTGAWSQLKADLMEPVDWGVFRLPPAWRWLYPALRPLGWVIRRLKARADRAPAGSGGGWRSRG